MAKTTPTDVAALLTENTRRYLANEITRETWSAEQVRLWESADGLDRYEVTRALGLAWS